MSIKRGLIYNFLSICRPFQQSDLSLESNYTKFGHNVNVCSIASNTEKNVMETKEVFYVLVFDKDKQGLAMPGSRTWLEFLFPQIENWNFEVSASFFPPTLPVTNYSMLHFSTMMMVIKCIYLCLCLGETVNLQINWVYDSLKTAREINVR